MTVHVIAIANMKGGVGKTAITIMLSQTLAVINPGQRVLIIDVDAQASASNLVAGDEIHRELIEDGKTIDVFLDDVLIQQENKYLTDFIRDMVSSVHHNQQPLNISLIASSPYLRIIERKILGACTSRGWSIERIEEEMIKILRAELSVLRDRYDLIVFDCAPGISLITEAALRVADVVILPTIPDYVSVLGLDAFLHNVWYNGNIQIPYPKVLINRKKAVESHNEMERRIRNMAREPDARFHALTPVIPETNIISQGFHVLHNGWPSYYHLWGGPNGAVVPRLISLVEEIITIDNN